MAIDEKPATKREETVEQGEKSPAQNRPQAVYIVTALIAVGTAAFYAHTYWWSESLTLRDVNLTTDEGLISLTLPLTRLAANEKPSRGFYSTIETLRQVWTAGKAGRAPLRYWMAHLDKFRADGRSLRTLALEGQLAISVSARTFMLADRAAWLVGLAIFGVYMVCRYRACTVQTTTLFIAMTLTAGAIYLLMH